MSIPSIPHPSLLASRAFLTAVLNSQQDKSVKILPGVRRIIDALPEGRYAVATSGAKTYCYGALQRVGILPPKVTITADDPRLKGGKPLVP